MNEHQQQQQAPKHRRSWQELRTVVSFWLKLVRARRDDKAFEQVVEELAQKSGIPPTDLPTARNAFVAVRDVGREKQPHFVDLYLVGGIGVLDLILLQVLLPTGASDTPLSVALFMLVLSLPLTAMSLFFSFIKKQYNIPTYGRIHSALSFWALVTGTLSLDGAIWHVSGIDGIVFFFLAAMVYVWAILYLCLVQFSFRFTSLQKPPEAEQKEIV
jgi:hypothetical protein